MFHELKPGDRMRVTVRNRMYGYQPGDQGTVLRQVAADPNGILYYLVAPDKDGPARTLAIFTSDEVEPDSGMRMIPMTRKRLKVGDRVRLTAQCRLAGYRPGNQGVVRAGAITSVSSQTVSYVIRMAKDAPGMMMTFLADEIEPAV
jgi:hypothetical protein